MSPTRWEDTDKLLMFQVNTPDLLYHVLTIASSIFVIQVAQEGSLEFHNPGGAPVIVIVLG